ncbi:MAG: AmpG family muropeptide MFS transporter, partial [Limnohabitans sp.]|nr:AmpG family muropeptide MFS transporter [Limnohabitans sp.]
MNDTTSPASTPESPTKKLGWLAASRVYLEPASWRMLCLGFSAGLPLLLVLGTLSFRLREAGIDRATIGFLSWVGLAYGFKWVWSPLVDRLPLPLLTHALGRRRSWLLLAQSMVVAGLVGMALLDPQQALEPVVWCALLVAFGSATQDIALDAFRIESADTQHQAALAATYQTGYRLAMIWAGAGVLWIAARASTSAAGADGAAAAAAYQHAAWQTAYLVMAASMGVGVLTVLLSPEPLPPDMPPARNVREWLQGALVEPFAEFIRRYRWQAALILGLIAVYRISDVVMGIMANPFYVDMGYTKDEVAAVTKVFGVVMTLLGAYVGGAMSMRWGVMRILML